MYEHGSSPRARQEGLLVETIGEEILIYDRDSHIAHCLSPIAACVWRHCDGKRDLSELGCLTGISENLVGDALHELCEKGLFDAESQLTQSAVAGISRREVMVRGVRYGAAAAAVPLIVSATAATPAMASSGAGCGAELAGTSCCVCKNVCMEKSGVEETESSCKTQCAANGGFLHFEAKHKCA